MHTFHINELPYPVVLNKAAYHKQKLVIIKEISQRLQLSLEHLKQYVKSFYTVKYNINEILWPLCVTSIDYSNDNIVAKILIQGTHVTFCGGQYSCSPVKVQ